MLYYTKTSIYKFIKLIAIKDVLLSFCCINVVKVT